MAKRKRQSALAGQSRRALSLGEDDPRSFRGAQGLAGGERHYVGWGLGVDNFGRLYADSVVLCQACEGGDPGPGGGGGGVYEEGRNGFRGGSFERSEKTIVPDESTTPNRSWMGL